MNLQASLVKAQQSLVSEFEDWMQPRVIQMLFRLFSSRIRFGKTSQWMSVTLHHFAALSPQPAAKSAKAKTWSHNVSFLFGGMNSNLNCHHFNVFKCFLDCLWIHVLTRSDTLPLERSIADVSSPLLFLKTQRLPSKRRSLYLESQSLEVVEIWTLWVFLKCSHGGPWFAVLVATGVFFLAANRCKSYIMIMILKKSKLIIIISCQLPGDRVQLPSLTWGAADGDGHTLVVEFSTTTDCLPRMAFQKRIFWHSSMYLHYSHLAMTHDLISWSIMTLFFLLQPWFTNSWNITVWANSWTQVSGFNRRRLRCSFAAFPAAAALVPLGRQRAARPRKTRRSCQNVQRIRLGKPDDLRWSEIRRRENQERMISRERQIMANAQRYFENQIFGITWVSSLHALEG